MDLEKIEIHKKFSKTPDFATLKHLVFFYFVIPIFSQPFTVKIVNYPVDKDVLWKKWSSQRLWL